MPRTVRGGACFHHTAVPADGPSSTEIVRMMRHRSRKSSAVPWHDGFLRLLPSIRLRAAVSFRRLDLEARPSPSRTPSPSPCWPTCGCWSYRASPANLPSGAKSRGGQRSAHKRSIVCTLQCTCQRDLLAPPKSSPACQARDRGDTDLSPTLLRCRSVMVGNGDPVMQGESFAALERHGPGKQQRRAEERHVLVHVPARR